MDQWRRQKGNPVFHTIARIKKKLEVGSKNKTVHENQTKALYLYATQKRTGLHTDILYFFYMQAAKTRNPYALKKENSKVPHHKLNKPFL